jgi:hypothetical protein
MFHGATAALHVQIGGCVAVGRFRLVLTRRITTEGLCEPPECEKCRTLSRNTVHLVHKVLRLVLKAACKIIPA